MAFLKIALRPFREAFWSQMTTLGVSAVLAFSVGLLLWFQWALGPVRWNLSHERILTAYLAPTTPAKEEPGIVDSIVSLVGAHPKVKFEGMDTFLDEVSRKDPELGKQLSKLGRDMKAVLPRFVTVTGQVPPATEQRLKEIPGIEAWESSEARNAALAGGVRSLQWTLRCLAGGLFLAWATVLVHLLRLNWLRQRQVHHLLELLGAGPLQRRIPGLIQGLILGGLGGALAAGAWAATLGTLSQRLKATTPLFQDLLQPRWEGGLYMMGASTVLALFTSLVLVARRA